MRLRKKMIRQKYKLMEFKMLTYQEQILLLDLKKPTDQEDQIEVELVLEAKEVPDPKRAVERVRPLWQIWMLLPKDSNIQIQHALSVKS